MGTGATAATSEGTGSLKLIISRTPPQGALPRKPPPEIVLDSTSDSDSESESASDDDTSEYSSDGSLEDPAENKPPSRESATPKQGAAATPHSTDQPTPSAAAASNPAKGGCGGGGMVSGKGGAGMGRKEVGGYPTGGGGRARYPDGAGGPAPPSVGMAGGDSTLPLKGVDVRPSSSEEIIDFVASLEASGEATAGNLSSEPAPSALCTLTDADLQKMIREGLIPFRKKFTVGFVAIKAKRWQLCLARESRHRNCASCRHHEGCRAEVAANFSYTSSINHIDKV